MKAKESIYTRDFALICFGSMLFSASYNMLIPELPGYLSSLGGGDYKGFIISLFTLTACLSRPVSGQLIDTIGRKPVLIFGTIVCLVCGFLYPILGTVAGFLLLRLLHGFSTGFSPTALTAYVSDVVPPNRWGEALGWQSLFFGMGLALGPALGSFIKIYYSFDVLFYASSLVAFLSLAIVAGLKETLAVKKPFAFGDLELSPRKFLSAEVIPPSIVSFLVFLSFGMVLTLIPDWSEHLGISYKGLFFILFTVSSLMIRLIAGKLSDQYGRIPLIYGGLVFLFISLMIMGYFQTMTGLIAASIAYGLAMGILSPSLNAWTIDLSRPEQRGKSIATMYIGLEAGIGLGALSTGFYFRETIEHIPQIMFACAAMMLIALFYVAFNSLKRASELMLAPSK